MKTRQSEIADKYVEGVPGLAVDLSVLSGPY